jgi:transcriptional regulatory protein RtcR
MADVCRRRSSHSDARRRLFNQSRDKRQVVNDADRLSKCLLNHGLSWEMMRG